MDANDCLRILGKYPIEAPQPTKTSKATPAPGSSIAAESAFERRTPTSQQKISPILAVAHLPLGTSAHATDAYQLIALITPVKLVVVGLKPTPKTWFRRHSEEIDESSGTLKWRGCLAWFPSVTNNGGLQKPAKKAEPEASRPLLAYSWGDSITVLRARETRISLKVRNEKTRKMERVESGKIDFDESTSYTASSSILAMQWLNIDVRSIVCSNALQIDYSFPANYTLYCHVPRSARYKE